MNGRLFDLTHPMNDASPHYPGDPAFSAAPLPLTGCDGSPVRAVAFV